MIFSQFIARRYLFSKKSTNAINLITGISILGITIGMASLILELAVFNGFESLLAGLFNRFNPDIKISALEGKFFDNDSSHIKFLNSIPGVEVYTGVIEEIALFDHDGNIAFATIKGVDDSYVDATKITTAVQAGEFLTLSDGKPGAVLGVNIKNKLGISLQSPFTNLKVYVPRTKKRSFLDQPFKSAGLLPTGSFSFQQEYDNQYVFSDLQFVQNLIDKRGKVSAYELKLTSDSDIADIKSQLAAHFGQSFKVQDRFEQDEAFFRLMNLEKWMFYALFVLTLILIAFNMVGALWMIVLDKKKDISIMKALGANDQLVRRIFLNEGLLISLIGIVIGSILALILYWYHINYGLISIPQGFIIDRYPMDLRFTDFIIATATMFCIGWLASLLPASRSRKISSIIRTE